MHLAIAPVKCETVALRAKVEGGRLEPTQTAEGRGEWAGGKVDRGVEPAPAEGGGRRWAEVIAECERASLSDGCEFGWGCANEMCGGAHVSFSGPSVSRTVREKRRLEVHTRRYTAPASLGFGSAWRLFM